MQAQTYDLSVEPIIAPPDGAFLLAGFSTDVTVEVVNLGPGICPFSIIEVTIEDGGGQPVHGPESLLIGSLAPGESVVLQAAPWTPVQTGNFIVSAVNTIADLDPLNDEAIAEVTVDEVLIAPESAINDVISYLEDNSPYINDLVAFMYNKEAAPELPVGTIIGDYEAGFEQTLGARSYFFWSDNEQGHEWMHASTFIFYNAWTGEIQTQESESWPVINGAEYTAFTEQGNASAEKIYGTYATYADDVVTYAADTQPATTEWALIVTGRNVYGSGERASRRKDVDRIKNYLNNNPYGPKLPDANIHVESGTNFSGATEQEVCDALGNLTGCDKLYFFYCGHGSPDGKAALRGGSMPWKNLACKLIENGAKEVCVCIEACHSGTAIPSLRDKRGPNGEQLKGEFVVSSVASKETKRKDPCGTQFYKGLETCSQDPNADRDEDKKITVREAIIWAAENDPDVGGQNPQYGTIDDDEVFTFVRKAKPGTESESQDGVDFFYCNTCFIRQKYIPQGEGKPKVKKTRVWEARLYARSKGKDRTTSSPTDIYCGKTKVATLPPGNLTGNKKVCFATLDKPCNRKPSFKPARKTIQKGGSDRIQVQFEDNFTHAEYRTRTYNPGEHIFHAFPIEAATGNTIVSTINQVSGWGLALSHSTMSAAGFVNPVELFITGDVPNTAVYGTRIFAEVRDTTEDDTSEIYIDALVRRTRNNDLDDGDIASFNEIELYGGINAYSGLVDMTESTVHMRVSTNCTINSSGTLRMFNSSINCELGTSYTLTVDGALQWDASMIVRPDGGLTLNSPSGHIAGGGIHDSHGDGLTLTGNFANFVFDGVEISHATNNGLAANGAYNLVVEGADISNSTGNDVVLTNGAIVNMLNSTYDAAKETADVNSILLRNWTTSFIVLNQDGEALTNANVTILDAYGTVVASLAADAEGSTPAVELTEYGRVGNTFYNFTPHSVQITWNTTNYVQAYTADELNTETIVMTTPLVTDAPQPGPTARIEPDVDVFPNPAGDRVNLTFTLTQAGAGQCTVFNAHGRIVETQRMPLMPAGSNTIQLNTDRWSSGGYYCILRVGTTEALARIRVLR